MDNTTGIYPATIIRTRYGGVYGRFRMLTSGAGSTPDAALAALLERRSEETLAQ